MRGVEYWLTAVACMADTSAPSHALVATCRINVAYFDGKLFAVGGLNSVPLSSVETLFYSTGTWVTEANALNVARYGCVGAI